MPWPWVQKWTPPSAAGRARQDSGSRKACSIHWVVNVSVTTWAAPARAASTSPRRYPETDSTLSGASGCSCGPRGRPGFRGDQGDDVAHVARRPPRRADLDPVLGQLALDPVARHVGGGED